LYLLEHIGGGDGAAVYKKVVDLFNDITPYSLDITLFGVTNFGNAKWNDQSGYGLLATLSGTG
jgi:hypothetical protein